jgi:hypothetical protein
MCLSTRLGSDSAALGRRNETNIGNAFYKLKSLSTQTILIRSKLKEFHPTEVILMI